MPQSISGDKLNLVPVVAWCIVIMALEQLYHWPNRLYQWSNPKLYGYNWSIPNHNKPVYIAIYAA